MSEDERFEECTAEEMVAAVVIFMSAILEIFSIPQRRVFLDTLYKKIDQIRVGGRHGIDVLGHPPERIAELLNRFALEIRKSCEEKPSQ